MKLSIASIALVAAAICGCGQRGGGPSPTATATAPNHTMEATASNGAPPVRSIGGIGDARGDGSGAPSTSAPVPTTGAPECRAPSLAFSAAIDAYDEASIANCVKLERGTKKCGVSPKAIDLARFRASSLDIDAATEERIVRVATAGKAAHLDPRSFALVGDSITVFRDFLRPFGKAADAGDVVIANEVSEALLLDRGLFGDAHSIIDWYKGHAVETYAGKPIDAFDAERAAKVGARASYPLIGGDASPLVKLVEHIHPAIAIVTFGANDAAYRSAPPDELADEFEANLMRLVSALEDRGVVVILENEMRHGDEPGVKNCPADNQSSNDWRIAVTTNGIVRRTSLIACREHLPLVDLRYALDDATTHGLGPDSVHPSQFGKKGGGHLDAAGLDCGFNIRSLVTLFELKKVVELLVRRGVFAENGDRP